MSQWSPIELPNARAADFRASNGGDYRIQVALPEVPPPDAGFQCVTVLDGERLFTCFAESARQLARRPEITGIDPLIIVGVNGAARRHLDFTPGPPDSDAPEAPLNVQTAGAAAFAQVLDAEIAPLVSTLAPVDTDRRALVGHSLSAFFSLWRATQPNGYSAYGALSPSIWWARQTLLGLIARERPSARFFLSVGEREQGERRSARRMVDNVRAAAEALKIEQSGGAALILANEDHASAPLMSAIPFLRWFCSQRTD